MIKRILAKNLFSYKNLEFNLVNGVMGIDGYNFDDETEEGAGKSSLPNILCWTLYGQIPKDAKIDDVIKHGETAAFGCVELESGYSVFRSRKPNELSILDIQRQKIKGKDAKETQKLINDLIGLSYDTFVQSVYFAQGYPKKFITANEADKVKILSEILDLDQFDRARKEVMALQKKEEISLTQLKTKIQQISYQIDPIKNRIAQISKSILIEEDKKKAKIKKLKEDLTFKVNEAGALNEINEKDVVSIQNEIKELERDILTIQKQISELEVDVNSRDQKLVEKRGLKQELMDLEERGDILESQITALKNPKDKKCPTCKTVLESVDASHFQEEIDSKQTEYNKLEKQHTKLEKRIQDFIIPDVEEIAEQVKEFSTIIGNILDLKDEKAKEINTINRKLELKKFVQKELKGLKQQLIEVQEEDRTIGLEEQITAAQEELKSITLQETEITKILKEKQKYYNELDILKDSYKEIKSYTFSSTLQELNIKTNEYLQELFVLPVILDFDNISDTGVSKITCNVTIDGISRPLGLYSGGQSRRLQLAVDLALSDIIAARGNKVMTLRIFDEGFKDLSEGSMIKVLDLLKKFKGATIIIEHNTLFKSIMENTVRVELKNGTSELCQ